ncbi:unnamed protein product [Triticum turgidum subsp. durum]|uniref:Uncharacterized protein n=1 Tax=Triticum turgidum subsp. durum TaxID=4567 RepID=A0A9R0YCM3_TRITD|nr:unnamed protein product [Triticum turgidum subsp. durum]
MARVEALSMSGATAIPAEYVRPQEERHGLGDAYDEAAASWQHLERKVLKKTNDQHEEEVKAPPVAAHEEKEEATETPVAGEEHKVLKKEQSEQEEAKMAPVAANLVEVN